MYTIRTASSPSSSSLRVFRAGPESMQSIVEADQGKDNLPSNFPMDQFLALYAKYKTAPHQINRDEELAGTAISKTKAYTQLEDIMNKAGISTPMLQKHDMMEKFGSYVEKINQMRKATTKQVQVVAQTVDTTTTQTIQSGVDTLISENLTYGFTYDKGTSTVTIRQGTDEKKFVFRESKPTETPEEFLSRIREGLTSINKVPGLEALTRMIDELKKGGLVGELSPDGTKFVVTAPKSIEFSIDRKSLSNIGYPGYISSLKAKIKSELNLPEVAPEKADKRVSTMKELISKDTTIAPKGYHFEIQESTKRVYIVNNKSPKLQRYFTIGRPENDGIIDASAKVNTQALKNWAQAQVRRIEEAVSGGGHTADIPGMPQEARNILKKYPNTYIMSNFAGNYPKISELERNRNIFPSAGYRWKGDTGFETMPLETTPTSGTYELSGFPKGMKVVSVKVDSNNHHIIQLSSPVLYVDTVGDILGRSNIIKEGDFAWISINNRAYKVSVVNGNQITLTMDNDVTKYIMDKKEDQDALPKKIRDVTEALRGKTIEMNLEGVKTNIQPIGGVDKSGKKAVVHVPLGHIDPETGGKRSAIILDTDTLEDATGSVIINKKGYTYTLTADTRTLTLVEDPKVLTSRLTAQNKAVYDAFPTAQIRNCVDTCTNDAIKNALSSLESDTSEEAVKTFQKAIYGDGDKKVTGRLTVADIQEAFRKSAKTPQQILSVPAAGPAATLPAANRFVDNISKYGVNKGRFTLESGSIDSTKTQPHGTGKLSDGTVTIEGEFVNGAITEKTASYTVTSSTGKFVGSIAATPTGVQPWNGEMIFAGGSKVQYKDGKQVQTPAPAPRATASAPAGLTKDIMTGAGFAEKVGASNAFTLQGKEFVITPGSSEVTSPNITDASQITPAIKNALKSAKVTLLKYNDAQGTPQRYPVQ